MRLTIESREEEDGRWLAAIPELPGVMSYGKTRADAMAAAQALPFRVIAEGIEHSQPLSLRH